MLCPSRICVLCVYIIYKRPLHLIYPRKSKNTHSTTAKQTGHRTSLRQLFVHVYPLYLQLCFQLSVEHIQNRITTAVYLEYCSNILASCTTHKNPSIPCHPNNSGGGIAAKHYPPTCHPLFTSLYASNHYQATQRSFSEFSVYPSSFPNSPRIKVDWRAPTINPLHYLNMYTRITYIASIALIPIEFWRKPPPTVRFT